jgi:hypothetical protein
MQWCFRTTNSPALISCPVKPSPTVAGLLLLHAIVSTTLPSNTVWSIGLVLEYCIVFQPETSAKFLSRLASDSPYKGIVTSIFFVLSRISPLYLHKKIRSLCETDRSRICLQPDPIHSVKSGYQEFHSSLYNSKQSRKDYFSMKSL